MTDTPEVANIRAALRAWFEATCISGEQEAKSELRNACRVDAMTAVLAHIDAQAAEIERLRKDASRYRFIRDADRSDTHIDDIALYAMGSLDEYIDAAMKEQK